MADFIETRPLSISAAAEYTGLAKSYIYKLVHLGRIACYKPTGGRLYFRQADLDQFIFRGRQSADYELQDKANRLAQGGKA
jgi:excisionase family DNA binding protein